MTPQEAEIIKDVFARLKAAGTGPVDAEAAGLVEAAFAADRGAGLALVRALVITERARAGLAAENEELKREIAEARASGGGRSGGLFDAPSGPGPWGQPQPPAPTQAGPWDRQAAQPSPWDRQAPGPWGQPAQPQGSGFWGSALRTGAGVAGGLFAFEALKGLFGGGHGIGQSAGLLDQAPASVINETVNVFQTGGDQSGGFGGETRSAGLFDASGDDGDGGDWSDGGGSGGDDWS
jgi:hypothetical protein